jgi:hypothetical protein
MNFMPTTQLDELADPLLTAEDVAAKLKVSTVATLARKKGDIKDVQGVLRHSRTATTTDVYMQELPEGVRATVNSIHQELTREGGGTGDGGPEPSKPSAKKGKVLSFSMKRPVQQIVQERRGSETVFAGR